MSAYNGHRSWNAWNVSLWLNNDEGLYREARELQHAAADLAAMLEKEIGE